MRKFDPGGFLKGLGIFVFATNVACKTRYYNCLLFVIEFTNKCLLEFSLFFFSCYFYIPILGLNSNCPLFFLSSPVCHQHRLSARSQALIGAFLIKRWALLLREQREVRMWEKTEIMKWRWYREEEWTERSLQKSSYLIVKLGNLLKMSIFNSC